MATKSEVFRSGAYAAVLASPSLSPSTKLTYQAILNHLGDNRSAWPSVETLMDETALSRRSVFYAIKRLQKAGFLTVQSGFTGVANTYTFEVPKC